MLALHQQQRKKRRLEKPGLAFTLRERWDLRRVKQILSRPSNMLDNDGNYDSELEGLLQEIQSDGREMVTVNYYAPEKSLPYNISGRVFAQGLQTVPGWVRRLCSHQYYHDIDIVNCFPVLLMQLQEQVDVEIEPTHLINYVNDRENVLKADMELVPGLTREEAKCQYLKVMFGGALLDYQTPFLRRYKEEIEYITEHLWRMREFSNIRQYSERTVERGHNVKASFLSTVITTVERKIIITAMKAMAEMGYKVGCYVFDGFMIERKPGSGVVLDDQLESLGPIIRDATGYDVKFVEKSLEVKPEDFRNIYPPFNNTIDTSNDDDPETVFADISVLARELNRTDDEGNPENIKSFKKAIIPMMNRAFARIQGTVPLVVVRRKKDGGVNDIKYQKMRVADALINFGHEVFFIKNGDNKPEKIVPIRIWTASRFALKYHSMTFNPRGYNEKDCASPLELNTFTGISYPQRNRYTAAQMKDLEENELAPFWNHVEEVWCQKNETLFDYVKHWIWSKVTRPGYRVESAIVLQSEQGAGKGVIVEKVAEIIGLQYLSKPKSLDQITGNSFNKQYFENCLIMFLDEAYYAGSKATKNQVKTIITDRHISVNEKYMPQYQVESFISMVLASNEEQVVNRDVLSRRYLNLAVSNKFSGIHADGSEKRQYFDAIWKTNPQILSDYLHSMQVEAWRGTNIPTTLEGEQQSIMSFDSRQSFVYNFMVDPLLIQDARLERLKLAPEYRHTFELPEESDLLSGMYVKNDLYDLYCKQVRGGNYKYTYAQFFDYLEQKIPSSRKDICRKRIHRGTYRVLFLPELELAREEYKVAMHLKHIKFPNLAGIPGDPD